MFKITQQSPKDTQALGAIEALLDEAFGKGRHAKRSYHFREGVEDVPDLRFVALTNDKLVGTIRFWPVMIHDPASGMQTPALLLGPPGVDPSMQGRGIGAELIHHGIDAARKQGHGIGILVGDLTYYGRFGFGPAAGHQHHITMPGEQDHRVLVRELHNDALKNVQGTITSLAELAVSAA